MQIRYLHLSEIDSQNQFCYHMNLDSSELHRSIEMRGIQMPLWLIRSEKVKIVDGFRRFHIAQKLGILEIPAILFDVNELNRVYLSALSLNSFQGKLSVIEKMNALKIIRNVLNSTSKTEVLDILNLHPTQVSDEILDYVDTISPWFREYLHRINISLKILYNMLEYPQTNYECWLKMANALNLKGTELAHMLEVILEICKRDRISAKGLWDRLSMDSLIERKMTPQQLNLAIKKQLHQARFPYLNEINQAIQKKVNQLKKNHGGNMDVDWDQSLEDSSLKFHFTLNESMAIDTVSTFLQNSQNRKIISDIFYQMEYLPTTKK